MPPYDISLILKLATKSQTKKVITRALMCIKDYGGIVGRLENLGEQTLPYKMKSQGVKHTRGFYMYAEADLPANSADKIAAILLKDHDILRPTIIRKEVENPRPCEKGECFFGEINNTEIALVKKYGSFTKQSV